MEKTVKIGGQDITIRALTWSEKKRLKKEGFNISKLDIEGDNDKLVEKVLEISMGESFKLLDELPMFEVYGLFREVFELTFFEEKPAKEAKG